MQNKNHQIFGFENKSLITNYGLLITSLTESRLVFLQSAPNKSTANQEADVTINKVKEAVNQEQKYGLNDIQADVAKVIQALNTKLDSWKPLAMGSILDGTKAESLGTMQGLKEGFFSAVSTLGKEAAARYERLTRQELVLEQVITERTAKQRELQTRMQTALDARKAARGMLSRLNPSRYFSPSEMWADRKSGKQIENVGNQITKLTDIKDDIIAQRSNLEEKMTGRLTSHKETREGIVKYLELSGVSEADRKSFMEGIESKVIHVNPDGSIRLGYGISAIGLKQEDRMNYEALIQRVNESLSSKGVREKRNIANAIRRYQEKGAEVLSSHERAKRMVEENKKSVEFVNAILSKQVGEKADLPEITVGSETYEKGEYITLYREGDKVAFMRKGEKCTNDLHDVIVYDKSTGEWGAAEKDLIKGLSEESRKIINGRGKELEQEFMGSKNSTMDLVTSNSLTDAQKTMITNIAESAKALENFSQIYGYKISKDCKGTLDIFNALKIQTNA